MVHISQHRKFCDRRCKSLVMEPTYSAVASVIQSQDGTRSNRVQQDGGAQHGTAATLRDISAAVSQRLAACDAKSRIVVFHCRLDRSPRLTRCRRQTLQLWCALKSQAKGLWLYSEHFEFLHSYQIQGTPPTPDACRRQGHERGV